jgi:MSHA biogenesis protein MshG
MAHFAYRARAASGELTDGLLEATSPGTAADQLIASGLIPLKIKLATAPAKGLGSRTVDFGGLFQDKVSHIDLLLFSRQLHTLLRAGIPILRALAGLQETARPAMAQTLANLRRELESGRELSSAMASQAGVFSVFYLTMVRVGEMTGRLEEIFLRLHEHLAFDKYMREQVKSALRYPSFVVIAMVAAIIIINLFVIPAFANVFKGFGADLPLMTRVLMGFSDFMRNNGLVLLGGTALAFVGFRTWTGTADGRFLWDRFKLKLPIAGKIIRKALLARFSRGLALSLKSGVSVVQGLSTVASTVENAYVAQALDKMRDGVERGESVLRTAALSGVFTPVVLQMIAVGEETGALDEMLEQVADMYQQEVEYELKTLAQQIEPILIVFLGIVVLVLALGVFLPVWDLGQAAIKR